MAHVSTQDSRELLLVFIISSYFRFLAFLLGLIILASGCVQHDRQITAVHIPLYAECEKYVTKLFSSPEFKNVLEAEIVHFSDTYDFSSGLVGFVMIRSNKLNEEQLLNYANNPRANCYPNAYIEGHIVSNDGKSILEAIKIARDFHHAEEVYVVVNGEKYFVHFRKNR